MNKLFSRLFLAAGMIVVLAPAGAQEKKEGQAVKEAKILAQAAFPFTRAGADVGKGATQKVIRSEAELLAASGLAGDGRSKVQLANFLQKSLKVDKMDYDKQMLILVTAGTQPSGGFKVEVTRAALEDKTMTVTWQLHRPKGAAITVLTHPATIILVDRFNGDVTFVSQASKEK